MRRPLPTGDCSRQKETNMRNEILWTRTPDDGTSVPKCIAEKKVKLIFHVRRSLLSDLGLKFTQTLKYKLISYLAGNTLHVSYKKKKECVNPGLRKWVSINHIHQQMHTTGSQTLRKF